jgi:predicted DNA-binding transcriptional regulator AlpA
MVKNKSNQQQPDYFIKPSQINSIIGISRSTALRLESAGDFPARVRVSPGQTAWRASSVFEWMSSREKIR